MNHCCGRKLAILFAVVVALGAPLPAADFELEFLAEATLPGDLEVDGTLVGGLSGLTYDPVCDLFHAISDDRGRIGPIRFYTLRIALSEPVAVEVFSATVLRDATGGLFERGDLDLEGMALHPDGSLYLSSEGVPHRGIEPLVARFSLDGSYAGQLSLPEHYLPVVEEARGVRDNHGFEGLSLTQDGETLFAATENALLQDGPPADLERGSLARLLEFDLATGRVVGEYLYPVEPVPDVPEPASAYASTGISEILAVDEDRVIFVERSFSAGVGNRVRLFLVDLEGAHDIRHLAGVADVEDRENLVVPKTLLADLHDFGVDPDNIEGLVLGPALEDGRRLLVMVADNNFQPSVQANQFLFFAISGFKPPLVEVPAVRIHDIQGAGHISPFVGRCVRNVPGVVTAILGSRSGQAFWLQDPDGDNDPMSSEGVLVNAPEGLPRIAVGDALSLAGRVEESVWRMELPVTRLRATRLEIVGREADLPPPVLIGAGGRPIPRGEVASRGLEDFDSSRFAADAFESLEGMRVRVVDPVVVGPTSRHGEFVVVEEGGRGSAPWTSRGGLRRTRCNVHPQRIVVDDRLVPDPPDLTVGDSIDGAVDGILHYSYGSYKLLNTAPLRQATDGGVDQESTVLRGGDSHLTIASFNVENLSAISPEEKFRRLAAVIAYNLGSPDIVALQEIQDDNGPKDDGVVSADLTLSKLVDAIESAGGVRYDARSIDPTDNSDGGQPGANIRNAFLFNPTRVDFVDRAADKPEAEVLEGPHLGSNVGLVDPENGAFLAGRRGGGGSRKPLAGEFRFGDETLFVVNLHLSSKGGDDPIFGRRQPRQEITKERRVRQAEVVAAFAAEILEKDSGARVVVLGDLNDFENTEPLKALEAAGLEDLILRLAAQERYSYVYLGSSQVLDHVLVSTSLAEGAEVDAVHLNSEFPAVDRASDHDPIVVRLPF